MDRIAALQVAASLPPGSELRREILARLKDATAEIDHEIKKFAEEVQAMQDKYYNEHFPSLVEGAKQQGRERYSTIGIDWGLKYARFWRTDTGSSKSAFCFVDRTNGDILKAATAKAPAKHARGNVMNRAERTRSVGPYGANYLRAAAKPQGKVQEAVVAYLEGKDKPVEITVMAAHPSFRGVHFAKVESAIKALVKSGLVKETGTAVSKAAKIARMTEMHEGDDYMVSWDRYGTEDSITLYFPIENIGRRGKMVTVRQEAFSARGRTAWGYTFFDRVKKIRTADQANKFLDAFKIEVEKGEPGGVARGWIREVKGIDKSLPTPSHQKIVDIQGADITVDLDAKPIRIYSKSEAESLAEMRMVYYCEVHPRFKMKLNLMRDEIAACTSLDACKALLRHEKIPVEYRSYMDSQWA